MMQTETLQELDPFIVLYTMPLPMKLLGLFVPFRFAVQRGGFNNAATFCLQRNSDHAKNAIPAQPARSDPNQTSL